MSMETDMKVAVILPAAGTGRRFNGEGGGDASGGRSKIELELAGKAVFLRAIELFLSRPEVSDMLLAVHPEQVDAFTLRWGDTLRFHGVRIVPGGTVERWETVSRALEQVPAHCTHVAVHDAARPLASPAMIDRVFAAAAAHDAVIPALPVTSTLKRVKSNEPVQGASADPLDAILGNAGKPAVVAQQVTETLSREGLVAVQTPQVFRVELLRRAYARLNAGEFDARGVTDDANLVEALGEPVMVVEGDAGNLKLTRREDLELFEAIVARRETQAKAAADRKWLFGDDDDE